jgi:hypothetical protein
MSQWNGNGRDVLWVAVIGCGFGVVLLLTLAMCGVPARL